MPLPLVPIIGGALGTFSLTAVKFLLPFIVVSLIKFLGVTLVTFTALDLATDAMSNYIISSFNNLGSDVIAVLTISGFLDAINILLAGWAAQIQLRQILGAFSKLKFNPPSST